MDESRLEALKQSPKRRATLACFNILVACVMMALYGIDLETDLLLEE